MPQQQTTHKDLHRAALGSALSLVYLLAILPGCAENQPHTASANATSKAGTAKLVKNEPAKAATTPKAVKSEPGTAPAKPVAAQTAAVPVSPVKAQPVAAKGGKLREIPPSTLNAVKEKEQKETQDAKVIKDTKQAKDIKETKASDTSATKSGGSKEDGKLKAGKTEPAKPSNKTPGVKRTQATASSSRLNNGLVPPPPPIVPIGMDALGMYAQPVDFLSMKELEGRKKELAARFNELDSTVSDGERQIRERKERAELFESLYQEGVVSRKELETAKREAGEIGRDLKFKQDELESVKISMKAVNNRLAMLKKMEAKLNPGKKNNPPAPKSAKKK